MELVKVSVLKIGKNDTIKEDTIYFSPNSESVIKEKKYVKYIGVLVENELPYRIHRQKAIRKVFQKTGWIKRIFYNRSVPFLKTIWNSLLQPHIDYGPVLTAPFQKCEILASEKPLKNYKIGAGRSKCTLLG